MNQNSKYSSSSEGLIRATDGFITALKRTINAPNVLAECVQEHKLISPKLPTHPQQLLLKRSENDSSLFDNFDHDESQNTSKKFKFLYEEEQQRPNNHHAWIQGSTASSSIINTSLSGTAAIDCNVYHAVPDIVSSSLILVKYGMLYPLLLLAASLGAIYLYRMYKRHELHRITTLPIVLWHPKFSSYSTTKKSTAGTNKPTNQKLHSRSITRILPRMEALGGSYGMYGTIYGISTRIIHVAHPVPAKLVLRDALTGKSKSPAYDHFRNMFGEGTFIANANNPKTAVWKEKRTSVIHALFTNKNGNGVSGTRLEAEANRGAQEFILAVQNASGCGSPADRKTQGAPRTVNIVPLLQRSTVGIIYRYLTHSTTATTDPTNAAQSKSAAANSAQTPHNHSCHTYQTLLMPYLDAVTQIRMIILAQARSIWFLLPQWCYRRFSKLYQTEEALLKPIRAFSELACRSAELGSPLDMLKGSKSHGNNNDLKKTATDAVPKNMRDEAITLLFAGQDTSAATLSWTLHLLSLHPDIQQRLAEEIASVREREEAQRKADENQTAKPNQNYITKQSTLQMPYLDAVLKESMRLYPVAPFVVRSLQRDLAIPSPSHTCKSVSNNSNHGTTAPSLQPVPPPIILPKYSLACIWIYGLHRNPQLWRKADDFIPERWLTTTTPPNRAHIKPIDPDLSCENKTPWICSEAYMPFAAGPRNCLGQSLALVILKIMLARIIQDLIVVDLGAEPGQRSRQKDMQAGFTVLPCGGVHVQAYSRP